MKNLEKKKAWERWKEVVELGVAAASSSGGAPDHEADEESREEEGVGALKRWSNERAAQLQGALKIMGGG